MRQRCFSFAVASCAAVLVTACAAPTEGDARAGETAQPILGGSVDEESRAVVGLVQVAEIDRRGCSGTLIAPNLVLTARHCVAESFTENGIVDCALARFGEPFDPATLFVSTLTTLPANPEAYRRGASISVAPGDDTFCGGDLAILVLEEPVEGIAPRAPAIDAWIERNHEYSAVGYGIVGPDDPSTFGTRRRRDGLQVRCVGVMCNRAGVTANEWLGGEGVCIGDSGGPALDASGEIIGVVSRAGEGCGPAVYGSVPAFRSWLVETAIEETSHAGLAAPAWALDAPEQVEDQHDGGCALGAPPPRSGQTWWAAALVAVLAARRRSGATPRASRAAASNRFRANRENARTRA